MQYLQLLRDQHLKFMYFFSISSASHAKNCMKRDKGSGCGKKGQKWANMFCLLNTFSHAQSDTTTTATMRDVCGAEARGSLSSAIDFAVIERPESRQQRSALWAKLIKNRAYKLFPQPVRSGRSCGGDDAGREFDAETLFKKIAIIPKENK